MRDRTHSEHCNLSRGLCGTDCEWARFHADLEAPILSSDADNETRIAERREALLRGDIPA